MSQTTTPRTRSLDGLDLPLPGTYHIDRSHSMVEFVGRYLMVTKVRGRFGEFSGQINIAENPLDSSVDVTIDANSIDTGEEKRDGHLRSEDFLAVDKYPALTFKSTRVERSGAGWKLVGDLTIRDVTREVVLDVEFDGATGDLWGNSRIAFTARTEIDREDWGLNWNAALETGGVLVGRRVSIELTVQAVAQS